MTNPFVDEELIVSTLQVRFLLTRVTDQFIIFTVFKLHL